MRSMQKGRAERPPAAVVVVGMEAVVLYVCSDRRAGDMFCSRYNEEALISPAVGKWADTSDECS
jgi:hypothetical protein